MMLRIDDPYIPVFDDATMIDMVNVVLQIQTLLGPLDPALDAWYISLEMDEAQLGEIEAENAWLRAAESGSHYFGEPDWAM